MCPALLRTAEKLWLVTTSTWNWLISELESTSLWCLLNFCCTAIILLWPTTLWKKVTLWKTHISPGWQSGTLQSGTRTRSEYSLGGYLHNYVIQIHSTTFRITNNQIHQLLKHLEHITHSLLPGLLRQRNLPEPFQLIQYTYVSGGCCEEENLLNWRCNCKCMEHM